ncbi:MAG: O-antigen ligase family protein [Lentisphaerae bacterium]|nr:O-antigen ligase family protein [Lentisphaerota bacterium]
MSSVTTGKSNGVRLDWLAGALIVLSPLAFSTRIENSFGLPRMLIVALAAIFGAGHLTAWAWTSPGTVRRAWLARVWPILAWLAWSTLTTVLQHRDLTAMSALGFVWVCVLPALALAAGTLTPANRRTLLALAVCMGGAQSLYALLQWMQWDPLFGHATAQMPAVQASQRVMGTIGYQNTLGEYLALLLPTACWLAASAPGRRSRMTWIALAASMVLAILLTRSRGAIGAACVGGVATLALTAHPRSPTRPARFWSRRIALPATIGLVLLLAVGVMTRREGDLALHHRLQQAVDTRSAAWQQRELIWLATVRMVPGHLLSGRGLGAVARDYLDQLADALHSPAHAHRRPYALNVRETHNDYLQMLAETGVVGMGLWLIVLGTTLRQLGRSALAGSIAAFMVAGLVSFPLHVQPVAPLFWMLVGLGLGAAPASSPPMPPRPLHPLWGLALVPLLLAGAAVLYGDRLFLHGRTAADAGRLEESRRSYARAERFQPFNPRLRFFHGTAHLAAGRPAEALAAFQTATKGGFTDLNLWRSEARARLDMDQPDAAVVLLRHAAATGLRPDDVYPELASALVRAGDPQAAVAALQQTRLYATETELASCVIARDLITQRRIAETIALLTPLAASPHSRPEERADVLELLGSALMMNGDYAGAERHLSEADHIHANNTSILNNLGAALHLQGRTTQAMATWQRVLRLDPTNDIARRNLHAIGVP